MDFVSRSERALQPFKVSGDLNNEYLQGKQHKRINPRTMRVEDKLHKDKGVYRERKIFNKMLPIYQARQSIMSSNRPIIGFKPDHNHPESVNSSLIGNKFIREFNKEKNMSKRFDSMLKHGDIYALVWIKTGIDWSQGDQTFSYDIKVKDPQDKSNETKITKNFYEGRPFVDIVPMTDVFPSTLIADSMNDINSLVHRLVMHVDKIKAKYGVSVSGDIILKEDPDRFLNQINAHVEYAYVYEYYEKPSAEYKNGRYVITTRNKVVYDGDLPYVNASNGRREIPFDYYNLQSVARRLPGIAVYNQLIDMQNTYNSIMNRGLEYVNHIAIGQVYEWADSLLKPNEWKNIPGERIILKKHAKIPQPVRKDKVGNELILYAKEIENNMLITASLSPLTAFGQSKSNMRADGIVDKIAESDNNKLTMALSNAADIMIDVYKKIIYLEKYRQEILIKKLGLDKRDDYVIKYSMEGVDPEELVVTNREFLMQSDTAIEKKTAQAGQLGLYNPENTMSYRAKLELLDVLDSGYLKDTMNPTERVNFGRIMREQRKMIEADTKVEVEELEMHPMHVEEHTIFLLSPELADVKDNDPEKYKLIVEVVKKHIDEHKKYIKNTSNNQVFKNAKAFQ